VRIEALTDDQMRLFLEPRSPYAEAIWARLAGSAQRDLFRTPYFLSILAELAGPEGEVPIGRAASSPGWCAAP